MCSIQIPKKYIVRISIEASRKKLFKFQNSRHCAKTGECAKARRENSAHKRDTPDDETRKQLRRQKPASETLRKGRDARQLADEIANFDGVNRRKS